MVLESGGKTLLWWWEPWWFHLACARKGWPKVFPTKGIVRLILVSAVLVAGTILLVEKLMPEAEINWADVLTRFALGVLAMSLLLAGYVFLVPRIVSLREKGIAVISPGAGAYIASYADILNLRIRSVGGRGHVLTFSYKNRSRVLGISRRIERRHLQQVLETLSDFHDCGTDK